MGVRSDYEKAKSDTQKVGFFLENIDTLVRDKKIEEAQKLSALLYVLYPDNEAVMKKYAKLLFWQAKASQADAVYSRLITLYPDNMTLKTYQQNRTLLKRQKAEALLQRSPKEAVAYIEGLDAESKSGYDLHLLYIQALIRSGDLVKAESEADQFYKDFPKSDEARHVLADLLFWLGKYDESLVHYQALYKKSKSEALGKRIAQVKAAKKEALNKLDIADQITFYEKLYAKEGNAQDGLKLAHLYLETGALEPAFELLEKMADRYPRDLEIIKLYMASLLKTYHQADANHLLYRLDEEDIEVMKEKYPSLYCRTLVNKLEVGGEYFEYSDKRFKDNRLYMQYETPIESYVLVALLEEIWRYALRDTNVHAELYRAFEDKWWGYLSFSFSPEANFLPHWGGGGHVYKGLDDFQLGFGYEYSTYEATDVHMFVPEYSYYFLGNFTWTQKLYMVPASRSYALSNQLGYDSNCHYNVMAEYTIATSNELIEDIDAFQNYKTNALRFSGEYRVTPEWILGGALSFGAYRTKYNRYSKNGIQLFVRRAW